MPMTLEGIKLGDRQKHFNKLVRDAVNHQCICFLPIKYDDIDIYNLFKIHTACKTKNVDYIIEILKSEDILYVSTAIKHSTWLITEQQHAHIVNPEYLYKKLFPHMLTRAINKLLLHIRLHLKDEQRVEIFYNYLKTKLTDVESQKWLINCSIPFIEYIVQHKCNISLHIYKRLCKRSIKFLPYYYKVIVKTEFIPLKSVLFLMNSNTEQFLNVLEAANPPCLPTLGKKHTSIVMKKCPNRILDQFDKYVGCVDLSVVAKYMKKEDIENFLMKFGKSSPTRSYFSNHDNIKHFIKNVPQVDRFAFVKKTFIDVNNRDLQSESCIVDESILLLSSSIKFYEWYQYAPFEIALIELQKLIRAERSPAERCNMFSVLIASARKNLDHAKTVLQYYYTEHVKDSFKNQIKFVNNFITNIPTHKLDSETWSILEKLFRRLKVHVPARHDVQLCLQCIFVYKVLHDEKIPNIINNKMSYNFLQKSQTYLNEEQNNKIFNYLITTLAVKINNKKIVRESSFDKVVSLLNKALILVKYWKRDVNEYTFIRNKIRELIQIKKDNSYKTNLSSLYDNSRSWAKYLFEESLILCPCEKVCLNALKHDPYLLVRYKEELNALRTDSTGTVKLPHLLSKIRIFWPESFVIWIEAYLNDIRTSATGVCHETAIKSVFVLLPQTQLIELVRRQIPKNDSSSMNQVRRNLKRIIAKNLYTARPLIPLDMVLSYAKDEYLQSAIPSLNAVLYNISRVKSRVHLLKLLGPSTPVQKYIFRHMLNMEEYEQITPLFSAVWRTTRDRKMRRYYFKHIFKKLCETQDEVLVKELWQLLKILINHLTEYEHPEIFSILDQAQKVPVSVRKEFYKTCYVCCKHPLAPEICQTHHNNLLDYGVNMLEMLDADFVAEVILAPIEVIMSGKKFRFLHIMSSFVLLAKTEEEQCKRYNRVLLPALDYAVKMWCSETDKTFFIENIQHLLIYLTRDLIKYITVNKCIIPVKLFSEITVFLAQNITRDEHYVLFTGWKLLSEYVKLLAEHEHMLRDSRIDEVVFWDISFLEEALENLHMKLAPKMALIIVEHLKQDIDNELPNVCKLFSLAVDRMFEYLSLQNIFIEMEFLKFMVLDQDYMSCYLVVSYMIAKYSDPRYDRRREEINKVLSSHPFAAIQMLYLEGLSTPEKTLNQRKKSLFLSCF